MTMAQYTISKCEPMRTFAKKDGSGNGTMQKIVLRDEAGKDYKCTAFSLDEAFVGDVVEATPRGYSEKFKEYRFAVASVIAGPRNTPNSPREPTVSVESEKRASYTRSPEESLRIIRQSTLKAVADLFSGKGDSENVGAYLALADQMTEWCMTGTATPRISREEREDLVTQFGSLEGATFVAMNAHGVAFLELLTRAQYDAMVSKSVRTCGHE
jgi:hypothetical protein